MERHFAIGCNNDHTMIVTRFYGVGLELHIIKDSSKI